MTGVDADLATLRNLLAGTPQYQAALTRVEAELARLREQWTASRETAKLNYERALAAEARCAAMEECDCIPSEFSSKACPKCGRRGVVTETTVHSLMVEIRDEQARCARLQQALEDVREIVEGWDEPMVPYEKRNSRIQVIVSEALAGPDKTPCSVDDVRVGQTAPPYHAACRCGYWGPPRDLVADAIGDARQHAGLDMPADSQEDKT